MGTHSNLHAASLTGFNGFLHQLIKHISGKGKVDSPNQKIAERAAYLNLFERQLKQALPEDYRSFLVKSDSATSSYYNTCDIYGNEEDKVLYNFVIKKFLTLSGGNVSDTITQWLNLKEKLPNNLLPIALDKFSNLMALSLDDNGVYFIQYQHKKSNEEGHEGQLIIERTIYKVASSFEDFFDKLYWQNVFS